MPIRHWLTLVLLFLVSSAWSAVSSEISRTDFVGTGSLAAYSTSFPVKATSEVRVFTQDASGEDVELSLGADYSAVLSTTGLCTVTLTAGNLTNGYKLSLQRGIPLTQTYNAATSGINAASLNTALDQIVMRLQRVESETKRSIKIPYLEAGGDTVTKLDAPAATRANQAVVFDASGNAMVGGTVGVSASAFAQTLLDDASASAALNTLGIANTKAMFVNIKDSPYNAVGDDATDDTAAIQAAINATGRVWIPAGTYRFTALTLPVNTVLQGVNRKLSFLKYMGTGTAVGMSESSVSRCEVRDLTVSAGVAGSGTGISFHNSSFNHVDMVLVEGFNIGILLNDGTGGTFSARNSLTRSEVNTCKTGIKARDGTNANSIENVRVWNCFNAGSGIGVDLQDADAILGYSLNLESCDTCLKIRTSTGVMENLYLENGAGTKDYDIDAASAVTVLSSISNGEGGTSLFEGDEKRNSDLPGFNYYGAGFGGTAAGHRQYVKNPDFSRGTNSWTSSGTPTVTVNTGDYKTGGKSYDLTATAAGSYYQTQFTLEGDVKNITVCARFKNINSGDYKINVLSGATLVGQAIMTTASSGWETRAISCAITDPTQTISVRHYPDATLGTGQVRVDATWAVRGSYAVAQRNYKQGIEVLATPQVLVSGTVAANQANTLRTPTDIPANASGSLLRVKVSGTQASTYATYVNVFNGATLIGNIEAVVSGRGAFSEIHCNTTTPTTGLIVTNGANSVTYSVELIGWILEE